MSQIGGSAVFFDVIARIEQTTQKLDELVRDVQTTADRINRTKAKVDVDTAAAEEGAKRFTDLEQKVRDAMAERIKSMRAAAAEAQVAAEAERRLFGATREEIESATRAAKENEKALQRVRREADKAAVARAAAGAPGAGGGEGDDGGGGLGSRFGLGSLGRLTSALAAVRALGDGFQGLAKAIEEGTDKFEGFVRGVVGSVPFIGQATLKLTDLWTEANNVRLLRAQGLDTPEHNELLFKTIDEEVDRLKAAKAALDRAEEQERRAAPLAGKTGFDLQRARARQQEDERSTEVGKLTDIKIDELPTEERDKIQERVNELQKKMAEDLRRELQKIDAAEGIQNVGKAVREWFKDLEDRVKAQAKAAREAAKEAEKVGKEQEKEHEREVTELFKDDARRQKALAQAEKERIANRPRIGFSSLQAMHQTIQEATSDPRFTKDNTKATQDNTAAVKANTKAKERAPVIVGF